MTRCAHDYLFEMLPKKKGFKLYYNEKMHSRKMKVEVVNYPLNWSSQFSGKKFVCAPDAYDAKTFWNHIMWTNTYKAFTSGYDGSDNVVHHDIIQVLRLVRKYNFDDACVCFRKDADNYSFI